MSDSDIKVFYFNFKGRAECIRLLLSAAGVPFTDVRFSKEEWPKYKADAPFGQCPYIEISGVKYGQTLAILQHLARTYGLYGDSPMDTFAIDRVLHLIQDLVPLGGRLMHEGDAGRKAELVKEMKEVASVRVLGHIEEIIKSNGTGFVSGSKLSLGDLAVYDLCNSGLKAVLCELEPYPLVQGVLVHVGGNPGVAKYLASRPDTAI